MHFCGIDRESRDRVHTACLAVLALAVSLAGTFGLTQENPKGKDSTEEFSPTTKLIASRLDQPVSIRFGVPLDDVLRCIKSVTKKGRNDEGIPLYVDPQGLQELRKSLTSRVTVDPERVPLGVTLGRVLSQLDLAYVIKDDVVFISSRRRVARERNEKAVRVLDATPATKVLLAKLEAPVSMSFANETPLADIVRYLGQATKKGPADSGIKILVAPNGLREVGKSAMSTVAIDLQGVPLKTTLRLLLRQLDLVYAVKDGMLVITSAAGAQKLERRASPGADSPERRGSEPN